MNCVQQLAHCPLGLPCKKLPEVGRSYAKNKGQKDYLQNFMSTGGCFKSNTSQVKVTEYRQPKGVWFV